MRRFSVAMLLATMAMALMRPGPTLACSCETPSMGEAFHNSEQIFAGTVTQIVPPDHDDFDGYFRVLLSVEKFWKGEKDQRNVVVLDPAHDGICQFGFELGETYLVYANWSPRAEAFTTGMCTRTARLVDGLPDLAFLDQAVAVESTTWSHVKRMYTATQR